MALVEYVDLIRHALPARVEGVRRPDPPLSATGRAQADAVGAWLDRTTTGAIITSDMTRARQTAVPLVERTGLTPTVEPALAEMDYGEDFYLPMVDPILAAQHPLIRAWSGALRDPDLARKRQAFQDDVVQAWGRVTEVRLEAPLRIFTHGGVIAAVLRSILDHPGFDGLHADFASVTRLRRRPGRRWMIVSFSEVQHLAAVPQPASVGGVPVHD